MKVERESLKNQIIPSLFYDKDGKKVIDSVQTCLDNHSLSKKEILSQFECMKNYKDIDFWTFFTGLCNESFNSDIQVNVSDDESFENMIFKLQAARFDQIFVEDDSMKVSNHELLHDYLRDNFESNTNNLNLSSEGCYRLVVPHPKKISFNIGCHQPTDLDEYPNVLVKIEGDKLSVNIHSKRTRNNFFKGIKDYSPDPDNPIIEEFSTEHLDSLNIDVQSFFPRLRDLSIFIKKVKFSNTTIYFNLGLKDLIDFNALVDSDYFLTSKMDFLSFQNIEFIYSSLVNNKGHDFRFKVITSLKDLGGNKYVKFMVTYYTDIHLTDTIKKEIQDIFAQKGLYFNRSYELPAEYYINNILSGSPAFKSNYEKLQQIDSANITLNKLIEEGVLSLNGEIKVDFEKLHTFKNSVLSQLSGQTVSIDQAEYRVEDVSIDKKERQTITVRVIKNRYDLAVYKVVIYPDVRDYDKITSIVLTNINYSYIIDQILNDNKQYALQYVCKIIDLYLKKKYNIVLEKEANNSFTFLHDYCKRWKQIDSDMTAQKAGLLVEKHLNILLKYVYKNYLPIGGPSAPDGYLTLGNQNYILDSKQHKYISQGEYDKVVRYIFTYALSQNLEQTNTGVFIICRGKIGSSLNADARKNWQNCPEFNDQCRLSFITIEYFLKVFEYMKEPKVMSNSKLLKQIQDSFNTIVSISGNTDNSKYLIREEDAKLEGISRSIRDIVYTPIKVNQL